MSLQEPGSVAPPDYVLGHSEREIERLKAQAQLVEPVTRRFFREAGLGPGMRVLDVGSGAGDVAFLAADIVGARGEVVGVDRVASAIGIARERAQAKSLANVTFAVGDPADMSFEKRFDAVLGRYVLQFQPDPAGALRRLASQVRPGGLVVFHEIDWGGLGSFPVMPTFARCCQWGVDTLRLHGTESRMGSKLHTTFLGAGLAPPNMRLEAPTGGMPAMRPWLGTFVRLLEVLSPEMERLKVATAAQLGLDTLENRLVEEAVSLSSVIRGHFQICAWVRV